MLSHGQALEMIGQWRFIFCENLSTYQGVAAESVTQRDLFVKKNWEITFLLL